MHKVIIIAVVFIAILAVSAVFPSASADWSRYRADASNTGVGTGSPVIDPVVLWNYSTGGEVSSCVVAGGVLYVSSDDRYVYALNAANGKKIWNCSSHNDKDSYCMVVNDVLYLSSDCVGGYNARVSKPELRVNNYGHVNAINVTNGNELWNHTIESWITIPIGSWFAPPMVADGAFYVASLEGKLYALDTETGQQLWSHNYGVPDSAPAVVDAVVYVNIFIDSYTSKGTLYALDAKTGNVIWCRPGGGSSAPAVVNGVVYVGSLDSQVYAYRAASGQLLWSYETGGKIWSSPSISNGTVYIGAIDGNVYALNATNGNRLWNSTLGHHYVRSSPSVAGGVVYVTYVDGSYSLYALNATTGSQLWEYNMTARYGSRALSDPVVENGIVYLCYGNSVYALGDSSMLTQRNPTNNTLWINVFPTTILIAAITVIIILLVVFVSKNKFRKST